MNPQASDDHVQDATVGYVELGAVFFWQGRIFVVTSLDRVFSCVFPSLLVFIIAGILQPNVKKHEFERFIQKTNFRTTMGLCSFRLYWNSERSYHT